MKGYIHANIYGRKEQAFLVEEGTFLFFGSNEEVLEKCKNEEVIDLHQQSVYPGFVDGHVHLVDMGFKATHVDCSSCHTYEDVLRKIQAALKFPKKNPWVIGLDMQEEFFPDKKIPTKSQLDDLSTLVPICLIRKGGQICSANSTALQAAGIDEDFEMEGAFINFEDGILAGSAIQKMQQAWPKETVETYQDYIRIGIEKCNALGITCVGSSDFAGSDAEINLALEAFEKSRFRKELHARVMEQCAFSSITQFAHFLEEGYTMDVGDDFFRIGPLQINVDGTLKDHTAYLSKPYQDEPSSKAGMFYSKKELQELIETASYYNMATLCHTVGDAALDAVLDLYEKVVQPGNPLKHAVSHCALVSEKQMERLEKLQIISYLFPQEVQEDLLNERLGSPRSTKAYPYKDFAKKVPCVFGSDAPDHLPSIFEQLIQLEKKSSQSISRAEALKILLEKQIESFTFDEPVGKLQEGYQADFVVVDQSLETCSVEALQQAKVFMTVLQGETVFER